VEDEPLERLASLGNDEKATGGPAGDERLFHRPAPGDELLVLGQQVRWGDPRSIRVRRPGRGIPPRAIGTGSVAGRSVSWPRRAAVRWTGAIERRASGSRSERGTAAGPAVVAVRERRRLIAAEATGSIVAGMVGQFAVEWSTGLEPWLGGPVFGARLTKAARSAGSRTPTGPVRARAIGDASLPARPGRRGTVPWSLAEAGARRSLVAATVTGRSGAIGPGPAERRPRPGSVPEPVGRPAPIERTAAWRAASSGTERPILVAA
jgi:hypothetical protein